MSLETVAQVCKNHVIGVVRIGGVRIIQRTDPPIALRPGAREKRMDQRVLTFSVLGIAVLALVITGLVFLLPSLGTLGPKVVQGDGPPTVGPKDFSDGIGIYYFNDGKYNFLIWKKKLFAPEAAPVERDIAVAAEQAIRVKKGVRFYSYGLDFSKLGLIPLTPWAFASLSMPKRSRASSDPHQAGRQPGTDL